MPSWRSACCSTSRVGSRRVSQPCGERARGPRLNVGGLQAETVNRFAQLGLNAGSDSMTGACAGWGMSLRLLSSAAARVEE